MSYDILVIDPPWSYDNKRTGKGGKSSASSKYDTMPIANIQNLWQWGLCDVMAKNNMLFMWTTNIMLPYAIAAVELWGYDLKTVITWIKKNYGLGNYFRSKTEHVLFATQGKIPQFYKLGLNLPNIIYNENKVAHSEKPPEFYRMIADIATQYTLKHKACATNVLEVFARKKHDYYCYMNWHSIGKEVTGNDIQVDLNILQRMDFNNSLA